MRRLRRGFTLAELAIVVAVIGIGGSLAAFTMSDQITTARAKSEHHRMTQVLRDQHRVHREKRVAMQIETASKGVVIRTFAGPDCNSAAGATVAPMQAFEYVSVKAPTPLCFNGRGVPETPGAVLIGPQPTSPVQDVWTPVIADSRGLSGGASVNKVMAQKILERLEACDNVPFDQCLANLDCDKFETFCNKLGIISSPPFVGP